jgi:hypothetical protein
MEFWSLKRIVSVATGSLGAFGRPLSGLVSDLGSALWQ